MLGRQRTGHEIDRCLFEDGVTLCRRSLRGSDSNRRATLTWRRLFCARKSSSAASDSFGGFFPKTAPSTIAYEAATAQKAQLAAARMAEFTHVGPLVTGSPNCRNPSQAEGGMSFVAGGEKGAIETRSSMAAQRMAVATLGTAAISLVSSSSQRRGRTPARWTSEAAIAEETQSEQRVKRRKGIRSTGNAKRSTRTFRRDNNRSGSGSMACFLRDVSCLRGKTREKFSRT